MARCSEVDAWSRRREAHIQRGQVTASCLWNACRAMVLGVLLVAAGAAMAALGELVTQRLALVTPRLASPAWLGELDELAG